MSPVTTSPARPGLSVPATAQPMQKGSRSTARMTRAATASIRWCSVRPLPLADYSSVYLVMMSPQASAALPVMCSSCRFLVLSHWPLVPTSIAHWDFLT